MIHDVEGIEERQGQKNLPRVAGISSAPLGTGLPAIRGRDALDTNLPILRVWFVVIPSFVEESVEDCHPCESKGQESTRVTKQKQEKKK